MLLLPFLLALQGPAIERPDSSRPLHDALNYDITLIVGDSGTHILGQVTTRWVLRSGFPIRMDLDSSLRVVRVLMSGRDGNTDRATWGRDGHWIVVPHRGQAGDTVVTIVRYHGEPHSGLLIGPNVDGVRTVFADNWPDHARRWFPAEDHPADKATVSFRVEVPPGYQVIANGILQKMDSLPHGRTLWLYRLGEPIPTYSMVVGIAPFAVTHLVETCNSRCVPISVYTFPADSAYAINGPFRRSGQILSFFDSLIGPFPYPRLSHVQAVTEFGGMENATAIFYNERNLREHRVTESTVAHETAHQWFGDAVTEDRWADLWLSESFASYFAFLWSARADGPEALRSTLRDAAMQVFQSPASTMAIVDSTADPRSLLTTNVYQKGPWLLHSLRGLIGDSAFFTGVREYYRRYRNRTATSTQFEELMAGVAGQDLGWFFRQALSQPGYPILSVQWRRKRNRLELTLDQVQDSAWGDYRLPNLAIMVDRRRVAVPMEGRHSSATVEGVRSDPRSIIVDPDGWWLLKTDVKHRP